MLSGANNTLWHYEELVTIFTERAILMLYICLIVRRSAISSYSRPRNRSQYEDFRRDPPAPYKGRRDYPSRGGHRKCLFPPGPKTWYILCTLCATWECRGVDLVVVFVDVAFLGELIVSLVWFIIKRLGQVKGCMGVFWLFFLGYHCIHKNCLFIFTQPVW